MALAGAAAAAGLMLPPAWKWQLGMGRVLAGLGVLGAAAWGITIGIDAAAGLPGAAQFLVAGALTVTAALAVLSYRFFRDPEREPPPGNHLVVSPADGEVLYVKRSRGGRIPVSTKHGRSVALEELTHTDAHHEEAVVVGIGMSFLDVHVNRSPIAGRVLLQRHFAGRFGSLRDPEMVLANERATTIITGRELQVCVVQIASRLVRQIVSFVREGEDLAVGQRIGVIRFGSQVDIVLPSRGDLHLQVAPGDRVTAGTSVIATLDP